MKKNSLRLPNPKQKLLINLAFIALGGFFLPLAISAQVNDPVAWWRFDGDGTGKVLDSIGNIEDLLAGNYCYVQGVKGKGLKFDGYTTEIRRSAAEAPSLTSAFTIEAWVAVAAFPWNWAAVAARNHEDEAGFALEIGPEGQLALRVFADGERRECLSESNIPWKEWTHVAGTYNSREGLTLTINGRVTGRLSFQADLDPIPAGDLLLGSNYSKRKAAFIHREFGTLPAWYSLDAILDEVKIYARALSEDQLQREFAADKPDIKPDIPPRILPSGPQGPGRFGAFYTRLNYYWEWDDLWRIGEHSDVVVRFEGSPVRVVFWRGTRYSPAWVTENNLWMADQSVEAWNDIEGCFEHMQDPHCKYSHVRILENTPARVVVHWRYAPVSSRDNLWRSDEKTGWACWVDEYYYLYPDQSGIRKVMWDRGSLGRPRQFQESIPLTGPGQVQGDIVNEDYVTVANLKGQTQGFFYIDNPPKKPERPILDNPIMQRHNLKAKNKPFIIFEPGSRMHYLKDMNRASLSRSGSCSHWPVGQIPCDGRTQRIPDRAASFLGFPITDPLVHEGSDSRNWVNSLYGMRAISMPELVRLAKSWIQAPSLRIETQTYKNLGYDRSQRAYILQNLSPGSPARLTVHFSAGPENPFDNGCLVVKGWGRDSAALNLNGENLLPDRDFRLGYVPSLPGDDLIVWLEIQSREPFLITLNPDQKER